MNQNVLGMELAEACEVLGVSIQEVIVKRTSSRTGVSNADSCRVIRQKIISKDDKETIELVVSDFKTMLYPDK